MDAGDSRSGRRAPTYSSRERGLNGAAAYGLSSASRAFSRQYDHEEARSRYLSSGSRLGRSRERSPYLSKAKERRLRTGLSRERSPYLSRSPLGLGYGRSLSPYLPLPRKRSPLGLGYGRSPSPYLPLPRARSPLGLGYSRSRSPYLARARSPPLWMESGRARSPLGLGFSSRSLSPTSRLFYDLDALRRKRLVRGPYPYRSPPRRRRSRSPGQHNSSSSSRAPRPAKERARPRRRPTSPPGPQPRYRLRVQNFPPHCSDESVGEGLLHTFKKHGPLPPPELHGAGPERYALLSYAKAAERDEALAAATGASFLGMELAVSACEQEAEQEAAFHREASMTLYVGNLDKATSTAELSAAFAPYGEVLYTEIKVARHNYGFVQFASVASVARAIREMNGQRLGGNVLALGFGKNLPTSCIWLCGLLGTGLGEARLRQHFRRYGSLLRVLHDTARGAALLLFKDRYGAGMAMGRSRRVTLDGHPLKLLFANSQFQLAFCRHMEASGQDVGDFKRNLVAQKAEDGCTELSEQERQMVAEASDEEDAPVAAEAGGGGGKTPPAHDDQEDDEEEDDEEEEDDDDEEEQPPEDNGQQDKDTDPQDKDTDPAGLPHESPAEPEPPTPDGPLE